MSAALLLAEPEPSTRGFLERHLAQDGFEVVGAGAWREALELAELARPDLVLVGAPLADASGLELCARLREGEPGRSWNRDVPLIVLGLPDADAVDRVRAFERGCDDYVPKPFDYEELLARIRAVLRRTRASRDVLTAGPVRVDRRTRRVTVRGLTIDVAGKEYELVAKLATDPLRVFTKQELLRDVWGYRSPSSRTRTLESHASRVRGKLGAAGGGPYVLNVWGVGYRLLSDDN